MLQEMVGTSTTEMETAMEMVTVTEMAMEMAMDMATEMATETAMEMVTVTATETAMGIQGVMVIDCSQFSNVIMELAQDSGLCDQGS